MAFDLNNLRIRQYPDPCLREVATTVTQFDEELAALSARMLTLMHQVRGVGLAAPQVGVALRLFVMNPTGDVADDLVIVNPQL
ncbi:MAG: peptide deformylase, partial [Phycisphaerae bacterium]